MNFRNTLLGIAIGDAFGAGVEFQDREWIKENVDFTKFINARHSIKVENSNSDLFIKNYKEWDYTDDTEMTIGVIKALLSDKDFSENLLVSEWKAEYDLGIELKGFGRNGHGSMSWFYNGEMSIDQIRDFQRGRKNPGNAPAMRSIPIGFIAEQKINNYSSINANATHPNEIAIVSSQCIARAAHYSIIKKGNSKDLITYCIENVDINKEFRDYLLAVNDIGDYEDLSTKEINILCGKQPIEAPYFLPGINGVPSDSKYTTGCVLYVLKNSDSAMDSLMKSIYLGGDVDSVASITTGISAGIHGVDSLPKFMIESVEGKDYLEEIADLFSERYYSESN